MTASPDLLAELVALFKPEPKPAKPKKVVSTPLPKKEPFTAETREQYLARAKFWKPSCRVHYIVVQTCQCCGAETEYLGNTFIRHTNAQALATWECPRSTLLDAYTLPIEFITHVETVEQCPSCLRAEASFADFPPTKVHQQSLFN